MDYRVLGPLEVLDGAGAPLKLGGRKPRALLARLLLDANRTVSVERLVDDLWGEDVPESAVKMVHIHVSALRKALPAGALQTRQPGYALEVDPETIDVVRFERLQTEGRAALDDGDAADRRRPPASALALWRGPALAEFSEPFATVEATHLEERRRVCLEDRIDAELALGRHADWPASSRRSSPQPAARAPARPADARALPLRPPGRRARGLPRLPRRARRASSGSSRRRGCASSRAGSCARTRRWTCGAEPELDARGMDPIRYVQSVGGYSIAYQVVGEGPLDIVFVHGWVCSFQAAWEWPALASFYNRLARLGRLILFDKRGTGLSDRVHGIASLEERMDDVRAVMDAVGSERAAILGVSEGGPMAVLFAATHPDRTQRAGDDGLLRAPQLGTRLPDRAPRASRTAGCGPTPEQWGRYAARRFLEERAPSIAGDEEAIRWYASYLVRGASPTAVAQITDMNEEIDVRHVLAAVHVPALVLYREKEYMREASPLHGRSGCPGARVVDAARRRPPAVGGRAGGRAGRDRGVP